MLSSLIHPHKLLDLLALAQQTPPGDFVEIGVYQGGSASLLYDIAQKQRRELHLFDTFTGIPYKGELDALAAGQFADADLPKLRWEMPQARFHVGVFPATVPSDLSPIAFIHFDADQYEALKGVRASLWSRVVTGGLMLLDDYEEFRGLQQACREDYPNAAQRSFSGQFYVVKT